MNDDVRAVLDGTRRHAVVCDDSEHALATFPAAAFGALITDPPSGITFMGAEWDHHKGGRAQWVAWLARILGLARVATRDGARALVWSLPRTSHWTGCAVEDAGWTIETEVDHLFGQGWPKGKSQLKPAHEGWKLARNGVSVPLNIDDVRIQGTVQRGAGAVGFGVDRDDGYAVGTGREYQSHGRWPATVELSHTPWCVCVGTRRVQSQSRFDGGTPRVNAVYGTDSRDRPAAGYADPDGTETVAAWQCAEGCPVLALDRDASSNGDDQRKTAGFQGTLTLPSAYSEEEGSSCQTRNGTPEDSSGSEMVGGIASGESREAATCSSNSNTGGSGRWPTARSPKGSTSTTSTTTGATTASRTSRSCPDTNTETCMLGSEKITGSSEASSSGAVGGATSTSPLRSSVGAQRAPTTVTASAAWPTTSATGAAPQRGSSSAGTTTGTSISRVVERHAPPSSASPSRFFAQHPAVDPDEPDPFVYATKVPAAERWCLARCGCGERVCLLDNARATCVTADGAPSDDDAGTARAMRCTVCGMARVHTVHPTQKSVALMRRFVRLVSRPGDVILDPFGGSMTTGVAALLEGRRVVLIERDPHFARIGRARLDATAPSPERLARVAVEPIVAKAKHDDLPLLRGIR